MISYELTMTAFHFAIICLALSCLCSWRANADYEMWRQSGKMQVRILEAARHKQSLADTSYWLGRLSLFVAVILFIILLSQ